MVVGGAALVIVAEGVWLAVRVGVLVAVEVRVLVGVFVGTGTVFVAVGVGPMGGTNFVGVMLAMAVGVTGVRVGATQSPALLQEPPRTKLPEMLRQ